MPIPIRAIVAQPLNEPSDGVRPVPPEAGKDWGAAPNLQSAVAKPKDAPGVESGYAWFRLLVAMLLSTIGGVGMWSVVVTLPAIQAEFGVDRAAASLPYTLSMVGFAAGGLLMGRASDRFGVVVPIFFGSTMLGLGYIASSFATSLWQLTLVHGVIIAFMGCSATFSPLIADISQWFNRNRGIAMAIAACGNYLSATIYPPIVQYLVATIGWRQTHVWLGLFCLVTMLPLALVFRRPAPLHEGAVSDAKSADKLAELGISPGTLQVLLIIAGIACCVAMSMPQVHIVAYCGDLGFGPARGAEMLALMMGAGVVSRLVSGFLSDYIGGLRTLLLGSFLQGVALLLYLPANSLMSLYIVSALFGLFQGGIIPSYALIVREFFPAREAGARIATCMTATIAGMAIGGWMTGAIYDQTGSYQTAFLNGIAWNALNLSIAGWMLWRVMGRGGRRRAAAAAPA